MGSGIRIQLWDESIGLSEAIDRLRKTGLEERALKPMIETLVIERSLRDYNILQSMDQKSLSAMLAAHKASLSETEKAKLEEQLNTSPEEVDRVVTQILTEKRIQQLKSHVIPSPLIQETFSTFKIQREGVLFQLLRVSSQSTARELYFRISHDHQDFDTLVRQYSEGAEAEQAGIIGPVPLPKLKPELREPLQALAVGETSMPFAAGPKRWLMIRLLRRDTLVMTPEVETQIRDNLFTSWLQQQSHSAQTMAAAISQSRANHLKAETCKR